MNERIKQVRQSAGLTQLQFAERLGVTPHAGVRIEIRSKILSHRSGRHPPRGGAN